LCADFNPHHRKVVTDLGLGSGPVLPYFNPHHRKVVTPETIGIAELDIISIHTTARW